MVLERILARTRERLEARRRQRPVDVLFEGLAPSDRSFERALRGTAPAFILEVKPRSPSKGPLRDAHSLGPVIGSYARHANAVSVLTEPEFFGGSHDLLQRVRSAVEQPVLAKDFILDPYQVAEARYHGADAVLLMLSVLDDVTYAACEAMARRLQMGILTEVHTAPEMLRARALGARVIGINNRDLKTLQVDVTTTLTLAPLAPPSALVIAESGIDDRGTFERVSPCVDGALVGSSLMRAPDVDRAVRALLYSETKICGITRPDDARAALRAGVTHGGLVFYPPSARTVSLSRAQAVAAAAPLEWVGVFVNERPERMAALANTLSLAAVQLHGDETAEDVAALRTLLPESCEVWRAIAVRAALPTCPSPGVDLTLFDGYAPGRRGGTGHTFDWGLLRSPHLQYPFGLAGGLTPGNVAAAARHGARLLDVSGGVESAPGMKDVALMHAFMAARRGERRTMRGDTFERTEQVA
jgi:indole-3-glycerol phosphate synthase/phosphoribosylanthranilate isomerase